jgi:hypothetical protein
MQCGGRGGDCQQRGSCVDGPFPGTACASGGGCIRQSEWYWQCTPSTEQQYGSSPWNGGCSQQVHAWGQCGGKSSAGMADAADSSGAARCGPATMEAVHL